MDSGKDPSLRPLFDIMTEAWGSDAGEVGESDEDAAPVTDADPYEPDEPLKPMTSEMPAEDSEPSLESLTNQLELLQPLNYIYLWHAFRKH